MLYPLKMRPILLVFELQWFNLQLSVIHMIKLPIFNYRLAPLALGQSQSSVCHLSLQWRHNGLDGVSHHHCLLSHLLGRRSKKTSKLRVTGLCVRNSPGTGEFPAQMASNAENVSIWRRHHVFGAILFSDLLLTHGPMETNRWVIARNT